MNENLSEWMNENLSWMIEYGVSFTHTFRDLPNPDALVPATSGQQISSLRPGGSFDFILVSFQLRDAFPISRQISRTTAPNARRRVKGCGSDVFAARRPGNLAYRSLMTIGKNRLTNPFLRS